MALLNRRQKGSQAGLRGFPWFLLRLGRAGGGRAIGTLSVWLWWERFTYWRWNIRAVQPGGLLNYCVDHHKGRTIILNDGTVVRPGDRIVEVHLNNQLLTQMAAADDFNTWDGLRQAKRELVPLTRWILAGELGDVRAIHGITLFSGAFSRVGLEERALPRTPTWGLVRFFMVGLLIVYHPEGWKRVSALNEAEIWPGELWLGIETLRQRAASISASSGPAARRRSARVRAREGEVAHVHPRQER